MVKCSMCLNFHTNTSPSRRKAAAMLASLIASLSFAALAESLAVTTLRRAVPLSTVTTHANHEHCPAFGPCAEPLAQDGFNVGCQPTHSRIITRDDWSLRVRRS